MADNQKSNIRVEVTDPTEFHCFRLVLERRGHIDQDSQAVPAKGQEIEIMLHARALVDLIHQCSTALCDWQAQTSSLLIQRMTGLSEQEARERGLIA